MSSNISLFTGSTCPNCVEVKKFLDDNNINYIPLDISIPANRKKLLSKGITRIPTIMYNDKETYSGSDLNEIREFLKEEFQVK
jgi:glutaredoxin